MAGEHVMDFFKKLAEAFFEAFAKAVMEYPFTTALVLAGVCLYVNYKSVKLIDKGKPRIDFSIIEIIILVLWFVFAMVISFFVGVIFNAVTAAVVWAFGFGGMIVTPFKTNPAAFTVFLLIFLTSEFIYFAYKTRFRIKTAPLGKVISLTFIALFATYVSTSIYADINREKDDKASSSSGKIPK